ncbi:related to DUF500 and SH3 domain protein [Phialocephala subalpina]|uniref:Related to DUF500 and SH3 domain protein n=1 Tax=Phialocephala subalpina TaxID=576137 RepID=A0A1L7X365_9HELO|nr:related to DUF500 and SH3 domain protein [Phialocephala subalpina]
MGIHNPLPSSMQSECKKSTKILAEFIKPGRPAKIIPPSILANAKVLLSLSLFPIYTSNPIRIQGLAILTVFKAGFFGSARIGSGLVVARLPDGTWSTPSAIALVGNGFGGQIGIEITDFVFILNSHAAVQSLSQAGSLTLGGSFSLAAGPIGRTAEGAAMASFGNVAGIFTYSKTKGFFAGVCVEGSMIVERRDANERLYGKRYTAAQLLGGSVKPPFAAEPLMRLLNTNAAFNGIRGINDSLYRDDDGWEEDENEIENLPLRKVPPTTVEEEGESGRAGSYDTKVAVMKN